MAAQPEPRAPVIHQVPGIIYSPLRNRARILGSGLEVFEIIGQYRAMDQDFTRLQEAFHWLSTDQLRAAVAFAAANPEFIEAELAELAAAEERVRSRRASLPRERE
jgi:uncharacterized protein (DUF433 family)